MTDSAAAEYTADQIEALEGLAHVRKRPGMYIGSNDSAGLKVCVREIFDNSVDEALAGFGTHIWLTAHKDGSFSVRDQGRGMPVDINKKTGKPGVEMIFTVIGAGGKFNSAAYQSSGGLNGVGASAANAFAARLEVEVDRNDKTYAIAFQQEKVGIFTGDGGDASFKPEPGVRVLKSKPAKGVTGSRVRFWPDMKLFTPGSVVDRAWIVQHARQAAFLIPTLSVTVCDERDLPETDDAPAADKPAVRAGKAVDATEPTNEQGHYEETFHYPGGMRDYADFVAPDRAISDTLHITGEGGYVDTGVPVIQPDGSQVIQDVPRVMQVEIGLRFGTQYDTNILGFVNIIPCHKGSHMLGLTKGLVKSVNAALKANRVLKAAEPDVLAEDIWEGLTAVVLVRIAEPQFKSQTKEDLGTPAANAIVSQVVADKMTEYFSDKKLRGQWFVVLTKIAQAAKTRISARASKEVMRRKNALETSSLPAKLADCLSNEVERTELFIIEGDSAGGCFTPDTLVALADGTARCMADLAADWRRGIQHYGYATTDNGDVTIAPLHEPRITKHARELSEVLLDNGVVVTCTPDHLFRLRDGSYKAAALLMPGAALMPLLTRGTSTPGATQEVWQNGSGGWYANSRLDTHATTLVRLGVQPGRQVMRVTPILKSGDVYDLTVHEHHNFALAAGVFVHNSAKGGRDPQTQALLPIRGKILNVQEVAEGKMLQNTECAALITAIGAGSGKSFDIDAARYGKLILMADADVDGQHIRVLLLTLVFRYMRPLLEHGRVYAAMPPLFGIFPSGGGDPVYCFTNEELAAETDKMGKAGKKIKETKRYKGLGEMEAEELAVTTMDIRHRRLRRINLDDAEDAAQWFDILMGKDVPARKTFIIDEGGLLDPELLDLSD